MGALSGAGWRARMVFPPAPDHAFLRLDIPVTVPMGPAIPPAWRLRPSAGRSAPRLAPALAVHLLLLGLFAALALRHEAAHAPSGPIPVAMIFEQPTPAPRPAAAPPPAPLPVVAPSEPTPLPAIPPPAPRAAPLAAAPALPIPPVPPPRPPARRAPARSAPPPVAAPRPAATASAAPAPAPSAAAFPPRPVAGLATNPPPAYPRRARRRGEQGRVIVRVAVGLDGLPQTVDLAVSSGHPLLDRAALRAVRLWRFVPAERDGKPVAAVADVPIAFRLTR